MTTIVGINAYHGDASACLVRDGTLVAAAEEERFRRIKHWAGFPGEAIRYCLQEGGLTSKDVDHVAVNRRPSANMLKKALFAFSQRPSLAAVTNRLRNAARVASIEDAFADACDAPRDSLRATFHAIEHHRAHMASAFFVSPFDQAAVVSVDGFGDFVSTMWGVGAGSRLTVHDEVNFPHSLGLFYLAMTQYLGFPHYGDEYKVMGLAPYGSPQHLDKMRTIVRLLPRGRFEIALDYFRHHSEGVSMVWEAGEPTIGTVFDKALEDLLGPARGKDEPISQYHKDLAASMQAMYEEAFFHLLNHVHQAAASDRLCLAGGCAMNSVANGKVFEQTPFRDIYIQSAAGDAGGAIGAAYAVWHEELGNPRCFVMTDAYLGPQFADDQIGALLRSRGDELAKAGCHAERISSEDELCLRAATALVNGSVVGWFQGRMEWGPRALGNRSILGDPRRSDMKDILNLKIKRRESFRPFAPSILRESVHDWFETDYDVPFMLQVYQVRPEQRRRIPAVTHVNGSGRLQTVTKQQNRRYYALIKAFEMQTGVPMVLNTSFNENEPVVCRPEEALDCFLRTRMDVLVLGEWVLSRGASA